MAQKTITLLDAASKVTDEARGKMLTKITNEFAARAEFERKNNPGNASMQKNLKNYQTKMALPGIAALMHVTNVDPAVINRSIAEGKRFNIYAIDKLNDLLHGLNSGHFKNAINLAVMRSMFKARKAGVPFTGVLALACASDKVKVDKSLNAVLVRHTVSSSTAPTQASSTMSALAVIGAVTNKGTSKFPIWELNDNPVVTRMEELLAA